MFGLCLLVVCLVDCFVGTIVCVLLFVAIVYRFDDLHDCRLILVVCVFSENVGSMGWNFVRFYGYFFGLLVLLWMFV